MPGQAMFVPSKLLYDPTPACTTASIQKWGTADQAPVPTVPSLQHWQSGLWMDPTITITILDHFV